MFGCLVLRGDGQRWKFCCLYCVIHALDRAGGWRHLLVLRRLADVLDIPTAVEGYSRLLKVHKGHLLGIEHSILPPVVFTD